MPSSRGSSQPRDQTCILGLLHWQAASLPLVPPGKPRWLASTDFQIDSQSMFRNNSCESHSLRKSCNFFEKEGGKKKGGGGGGLQVPKIKSSYTQIRGWKKRWVPERSSATTWEEIKPGSDVEEHAGEGGHT